MCFSYKRNAHEMSTFAKIKFDVAVWVPSAQNCQKEILNVLGMNGSDYY